jgi:hypothetical protein
MKAYFLALQFRLHRLVLLQPVQILQEQQPGGLFGVIEFGGATGLFAQVVVDVFEGLFKHGGMFRTKSCHRFHAID